MTETNKHEGGCVDEHGHVYLSGGIPSGCQKCGKPTWVYTPCCGKCADFAFGEDTDCRNKNCPCHTPVSEPSYRTSEAETERFTKAFTAAPTPPPTGRSVKDLTMEEAQELVASGQGAFIPTPPPTEWEDTLDNLAKQWFLPNEKHSWRTLELVLKSFIRETITQALAEQKARMVEEVEGMKEECTECENREKHDTPRNMLIDDIIKTLSK